MNSTVTLTNSSEFYLSNEEVFLRGIPTAINVGSLTTDALRLLVFYVAKSGPYKLAVESGFFTGTLEEWLNSLHGTGEGAGIQGPKGKSAYELYVESVQAPAEALSLVDWLNSLVGAQGAKGDVGAAFTYADFTPEQLALLKGTTGDQGLKGDKGEDGVDGLDGKSAYQLALAANPVIGTEVEWLASLKGATGDVGAKGTDGLQGLKGDTGTNGTDGAKGDKGDPGLQGVKGDDGADGVTQNATTITFTGLVTDTATPVLDTDTLLIVIGKLQAQITALETRVVALETV